MQTDATRTQQMRSSCVRAFALKHFTDGVIVATEIHRTPDVLRFGRTISPSFSRLSTKTFVVFIKRRHKTSSSSQNVVVSFYEKTVLKAQINKMISKQKTQVAKNCESIKCLLFDAVMSAKNGAPSACRWKHLSHMDPVALKNLYSLGKTTFIS